MTDEPDVYQFIKAVRSSKEEAANLLSRHPNLLEARTRHVGETALHYLVIENEIPEVEWLLKQGADINARCNSETTPLMYAAQLGYVEMVQLLIRSGAMLNLLDNFGETAILKAATYGSPETLECLLQAGADPLITNGIDFIFSEFSLHKEKREELLAILAKFGFHPE